MAVPGRSADLERWCLCDEKGAASSRRDHHSSSHHHSSSVTSSSSSDGCTTAGGSSTPRTRVLCPACVHRGLDAARARHRAAQQNLDAARRECGARLRELLSRRLRVAQFQDEIEQLSSLVADRRNAAGEMAIRVARGAVQVEALQQELRERSRSIPDGEYLRQLRTCVFEGGLQRAVQDARGHEVALRFAWACQAFRLHRMDVDEADPGDQAQIRAGRMKHARGVGKIGGLPLPHAGPELFGVLPPPELESALRLVASATSLVARCLNVALPHPIRLRLEGQPTQTQDITRGVPSEFDAIIASPPANKAESHRSGDGTTMSSRTMENLSEALSSSTSSLASLIRGGASSGSALFARAVRGAVSTALPTLLEESSSSAVTTASHSPPPPPSAPAALGGGRTQTGSKVPPPSMEPDVVRRRVEHARAAMVAEDGTAATWYRLSLGVDDDDEGGEGAGSHLPSPSRQDEFATALQLLQNDVIALCIRSGVAIDRLWPAEALLLNLHELQKHCRDQVAT